MADKPKSHDSALVERNTSLSLQISCNCLSNLKDHSPSRFLYTVKTEQNILVPLALLLVQFFKGQSVDIVSFPQAQLQLTGKFMIHFLTKIKPLKVRKVTFQSVLGAPAKVKRRQELREAERKSAQVTVSSLIFSPSTPQVFGTREVQILTTMSVLKPSIALYAIYCTFWQILHFCCFVYQSCLIFHSSGRSIGSVSNLEMCGISLNTETDLQLIMLSESFQHSLLVMERSIVGNIFQTKLAAYKRLPILQGTSGYHCFLTVSVQEPVCQNSFLVLSASTYYYKFDLL